MSAKQIIQDNRDKLLQILLYEKYQKYKKEYDNYHNNCVQQYNIPHEYTPLNFDEWLEQILEDF